MTWRDWWAMGRMSNLPSVVSNVLAGAALAGTQDGLLLGCLVLAAGCLYVGGAFLNDWADVGWDKVHRPERPLPQGKLLPWMLLLMAANLLLAGVVTCVTVDPAAGPWGLALLAAIVLYTWSHRRTALALLPMGLCRAFLYPLGALGQGSGLLWAGAAGLAVYVMALTWWARRESEVRRRRPQVEGALAGICLYDALVLLLAGVAAGPIALALGLFGLSFLLQKAISGT
ncbi:MAG: UbiA family prenyltransferase [Verrucomicrobiota bacterium]